ncbi:MAG: restriction endonuclease subunit S, partial [Firmicutes bacterium]|nr:restriction endonuclease subunit S [Bacillota bacterium]
MSCNLSSPRWSETYLPSGWKILSVDEIKDEAKNSLAIGPFGSRMKANCYVESGTPVIRGNNISDTKKFNNDFVYITKEKAEQLSSCLVFNDDLIFPHRGLIGEVGIVCCDCSERYMLSTSLMKLTPNKKIANSLFLFYYFRSPIGRYELLKNASQVGTPGIATPLTSLRSIEVKLPPLEEQKAIAHILGALDDKIELNRQMNKNLEGVARALFKSWFVDFDPVRAKMEGRDTGLPAEIADLFPDKLIESAMGEIPEGWEVKALDEIADFLNGLALQNYPPENDKEYLPVIKIAELRAGVKDSTNKASPNIDEKYILQDGDIVFSWSGSLLVCLWYGGKGALNQHLFKVTSKYYPKWFYYHWLLIHLSEFQSIAKSKATTMGHIQRHHLKEALTVTCDERAMNMADKVFKPILLSIIDNS